MSGLCDVTADLPPAANLRAFPALTAETAATLAEELAAYHRHFAPAVVLSARTARVGASLPARAAHG
jgi:hypothetical protein